LFHDLCNTMQLCHAPSAHPTADRPACAFLIVIVPLFYFLLVILVVLLLLLRFAGPH
jgi:hypothetical protein